MIGPVLTLFDPLVFAPSLGGRSVFVACALTTFTVESCLPGLCAGVTAHSYGGRIWLKNNSARYTLRRVSGRVHDLLGSLFSSVACRAQGNQIAHVVLASDTERNDVMHIERAPVIFRCLAAFLANLVARSDALRYFAPAMFVVEPSAAPARVILLTQKSSGVLSVHKKASGLRSIVSVWRERECFTTAARATELPPIFRSCCNAFRNRIRGGGVLPIHPGRSLANLQKAIGRAARFPCSRLGCHYGVILSADDAFDRCSPRWVWHDANYNTAIGVPYALGYTFDRGGEPPFGG